LVCFNCDGIGIFSSKCPHKKNKRNEEDDSNRKKKHTKEKEPKINFQENIFHQRRQHLIR